MERRHFVASMAAMIPLAAAARPRGAAAAGHPLKVLTTRVANGIGGMPPAAGRWRLVRVTDRAFDPLSIALVDDAGTRHGYVPPARAGVLAALLDAGAAGFATTSREAPGKVDVYLSV
jgi:hypothetical protein